MSIYSFRFENNFRFSFSFCKTKIYNFHFSFYFSSRKYHWSRVFLSLFFYRICQRCSQSRCSRRPRLSQAPFRARLSSAARPTQEWSRRSPVGRRSTRPGRRTWSAGWRCRTSVEVEWSPPARTSTPSCRTGKVPMGGRLTTVSSGVGYGWSASATPWRTVTGTEWYGSNLSTIYMRFSKLNHAAYYFTSKSLGSSIIMVPFQDHLYSGGQKGI